MAVGLFLLSRLDVGTSTFTSVIYLLILGLGLGSTMQVLVLAVQNAVSFEVLGAATSGVTLFRGIGGSLGAAVFGTIFSSRLASGLKGLLSGPVAHQVGAGGRLTGAQVAHLPPVARSAYEHAYVHALSPVFLAAGGVALLGFALSWLLPERPLRDTAATSRGLEDSLAAPRSPDSLAEIERALTCAISPEVRRRFRERVTARSGVDLTPGATWALVRISEHGAPRARELADQDGVPPDRVAAVIEELRQRSLLAGDGSPELTAEGRTLAGRAVAARRELLDESLADPVAERDPGIDALLRRLATELAGDPPVGQREPGPIGSRSSLGVRPRATPAAFVLPPARADLRRKHERPGDADDQDEVECHLDDDEQPRCIGARDDVPEPDRADHGNREVHRPHVVKRFGELMRVRVRQRQVDEREHEHEHGTREREGLDRAQPRVGRGHDLPDLPGEQPGEHQQADDQLKHDSCPRAAHVRQQRVEHEQPDEAERDPHHGVHDQPTLRARVEILKRHVRRGLGHHRLRA